MKNLYEKFQNENILFLQGPLGPFFKRLSKKLRENNKIYKLNFTGGDFLFFPSRHNYRGDLSGLKGFLQDFYIKNKITCIILFGDTRAVHEIAIAQANKQNIKIYVFEEGYLRPNYITCEPSGVNANSKMPKNREFYKALNIYKNEGKKLPASFSRMAFYAFFYYLASICAGLIYNNSLYHRPLNALELFKWLRHFYKLFKYKLSEKNVERQAIKHSKKYFLAILQVHNDSQIKKHFKDKGMKKFIVRCIKSFAKNANKNNFLIIKHHPLDLAYTDYTELISKLAARLNLSERIIYIHRGHLPTLLKNAKGCVCINSTVGMQALYHNCPVIALGNAIYDIDKLVYKKSLDSFWQNAHNFAIDYDLYLKFQGYLLKNNQYNANFYLNFKEFEIGK